TFPRPVANLGKISDGEYWKHELRPACDAQADQQAIIRDELHLPPWRWPPVQNPNTQNPYPAGSPRVGGVATAGGGSRSARWLIGAARFLFFSLFPLLFFLFLLEY